jgi:SecD/SecF fusion protein
MQSKGAIKFLAILIAIICVFQLSFTFVTNHLENKAHEATNGNPEAYKAYIDSIGQLTAYNLGFKKYTYQECKEREMNLGLDLKGGMNVTLEVSVADLIRNMSNNPSDPILVKALNDAQGSQTKSQKGLVTLFGEAFEKNNPGAKLASLYSTMDLQSKVNFNSTNDQVLKVIQEEANAAISRTYNILRTRIDKFGVTQPNIQQLGGGRILIELPGVKEPERVRKLLQGTAQLEFWETFDNAEVFPKMEDVNKRLAGLERTEKADSAAAGLNNDVLNTDSTTIASADTGANKKPALLSKLDSDTTAAKDTSAEAKFNKFSKENPLFALLTPAIFNNAQGQSEYRKGPVVGYAAIKDTGKLNAIFERPEIKNILPRDLRLLWTAKSPSKESKFLELIAIKVKSRDGSAPMDGAAITDARQDFGQFNSSPEISMSMNPEGAKTWKRLTGENIGHSIAIVLDNYVYSYPNVQGEIAGGRSSITGNFTIAEAQDLANILKAGKLPAPAKIVEESIVGPSLGQEAIQNSWISFAGAFVVILLFMGFYYMRAGWVANIALFANIFFIMGVLASLGAVLTLPGIAGIVLTIGLSVDANILIFERVREELRAGKGIRLAISDGFKHAMPSILDSNITLLILGIVLYIFGSGPVQGFATTLIIGVLTSLFSAVLLSRLIFENLLDKSKPISFGNDFSNNVYKNIHFNFVDNRKKYYVFSSIIIIAGIVAFGMKGLNYGVDFEGGRTYTVQMDKNLSTEDIRLALAPQFGEAPEVKSVGTVDRFKITTAFMIHDTTANVENVLSEKLYQGLKPLYSSAPDLATFKSKNVISSQKVGPTIADDIKNSAVWAVLISCLLMFVYIFIRFKKWQYGLGAVVALFHDVLIVLSIFAIFNGILPIALEIDQHFIAAILTVMGYTMTESVVVFDRIREYLGQHHTADDKHVINEALNATLSRTINTTLTVFFVLIVIFIFGGEVIRGFIFALLIGRVIGTYSSLCISTPIVIDFGGKATAAIAKK